MPTGPSFRRYVKKRMTALAERTMAAPGVDGLEERAVASFADFRDEWITDVDLDRNQVVGFCTLEPAPFVRSTFSVIFFQARRADRAFAVTSPWPRTRRGWKTLNDFLDTVIRHERDRWAPALDEDLVDRMRAMIRLFPRASHDATASAALQAWQEACRLEERPDLEVKPEDATSVILGGFAHGILVGQQNRRKKAQENEP